MADKEGVDQIFSAIRQARSEISALAGKSDGKEDIDSETLSEQIDLKRAQTDRYKSDTKDRKWLAEWSTTVVSLWLFFVLLILITNHEHLHLSDSVLNILLGTTTLNVLGLMYIVLKGHFNKEQ